MFKLFKVVGWLHVETYVAAEDPQGAESIARVLCDKALEDCNWSAEDHDVTAEEVTNVEDLPGEGGNAFYDEDLHGSGLTLALSDVVGGVDVDNVRSQRILELEAELRELKRGAQ